MTLLFLQDVLNNLGSCELDEDDLMLDLELLEEQSLHPPGKYEINAHNYTSLSLINYLLFMFHSFFSIPSLCKTLALHHGLMVLVILKYIMKCKSFWKRIINFKKFCKIKVFFLKNFLLKKRFTKIYIKCLMK